MIDRVVSHYRIVRHIAAGGMGTVYLADDTRLHRRVALKFLPSDAAGLPQASDRLLREARAASSLDHPHIGTIFEIGEADGQPFIAMAYYEGETLAARLARGPLPMAEAARVIAETADALAGAHSAGIVHRDLKPSNLMLTTSGHVKVLDFGIAMFVSAESETLARLTGAGMTVGTAGYMSPEQAAGDDVDARSDLWSLGVVAYEMLAGRLPFEGSNPLALIQAVLTAPLLPIRSRRPDVASELEEIIARTMVRNRGERAITAADVRDLASACHTRLSSSASPVAPRSPARRRAAVAIVAAILLALGGTAAWWTQRNAQVRWAREQALPEVIGLREAGKFSEAFSLATQALQHIPTDPQLSEQMRLVSRKASVESVPEGASVSYRPYGRPSGPWTAVGRTPAMDVVVPRGVLHWKAELDGFEPAEDVTNTAPRFGLVRTGAAPAGMVRIASAPRPLRLALPGLEHLPPVKLPDFWIDRHEVTNREFKRFLDDGGYQRPGLWREPFVKDGQTIAFAAAMALLVDTAGRPGPATWEQGRYPAGQDDHPVGGVSWYEAAAFARWADKSLPTIFHWSRVAGLGFSGDVVPGSNFGGKGLLPVGKAGGSNRGGTTGMAGNVKEWCRTSTGAKRYILGGGWSEPPYMFNDADAQPPFARGPAYGFRCIKAVGNDPVEAGLTADVTTPSRDLRDVAGVPDAVFRAWQSMYAFDHDRLNPTVDGVDASAADWRVERVSYAAAYGDERIPAFLLLPKRAKPPYQTLVYFPHSGQITNRSDPDQGAFEILGYIMRSGRALLYPIYKSTHTRGDVIQNDYPTTMAVWRDHMVMWSKDVGRSIDYLHTRPDIDKDRIGYLGHSFGAVLAPVLVAVEPRLSLALLNVGGFPLQDALPEADPIYFAPRVKVPILMLNGRYDFLYPTETSQEPMFRSFGTPAEHKRRVVYDAAHSIPRHELIKEFTAWMDKYWGPVR